MASCGFAAGLLLAVLSAIAAVDGGTVTGSAILVTVDKDGKTEVLVGKPSFNESQILTFLAALNPFLRPIPVSSRSTRAVEDVYSINVTTEQVVLVAPSWWEGSEPGKEDEYIAYLLPNGLNSMTDQLKNQILSPAEGKRKIGMLMYPADITFFPNLLFSQLFPLESMTIKDVRMVDKDMTGLKVNVFMDVFGNARVGMYDAPWLILREVPEDAVVIDGEDGMEKPMEGAPVEQAPKESDAESTSRSKRSPDPDVAVSGGVGTIVMDKDGVVTYSVVPYVGVPPLIPTPPIPLIPAIPPIPIPDWSLFNPFNPWFYPFWPFLAAQDASQQPVIPQP